MVWADNPPPRVELSSVPYIKNPIKIVAKARIIPDDSIIFIAKSSKYICRGGDARPIFDFFRVGETGSCPYGDVENIGWNAVIFRFFGEFAPIKTRIAISDDESVPTFRFGRLFGHRMPKGFGHGFVSFLFQTSGSSPKVTGVVFSGLDASSAKRRMCGREIVISD